MSGLEQTVLGKGGSIPARGLGRSPLSAACEVRVAPQAQQKEQHYKKSDSDPIRHFLSSALEGSSPLTEFLTYI